MHAQETSQLLKSTDVHDLNIVHSFCIEHRRLEFPVCFWLKVIDICHGATHHIAFFVIQVNFNLNISKLLLRWIGKRSCYINDSAVSREMNVIDFQIRGGSCGSF